MKTMSLRDAHREYLPEVDLCMCELCRAIQRVQKRPHLAIFRDDVAFYGAVSDRLRALVEDRHVRVEWADYVASIHDPSAPIPRQSQGWGCFIHGAGLGIGPKLQSAETAAYRGGGCSCSPLEAGVSS